MGSIQVFTAVMLELKYELDALKASPLYGDKRPLAAARRAVETWENDRLAAWEQVQGMMAAYDDKVEANQRMGEEIGKLRAEVHQLRLQLKVVDNAAHIE